MSNTFTNFVPIKAKPHASAEKQVGDSDPNARTDVINRPTKGLQAAVKRIVNSLWDGKTGAIDKSVFEHWEKYDLRLVLERNWKTLGPKLAGGKVHIWVGDADDYSLNNAVHRLKSSLAQRTDPKFDGTILIEMRKPHTSGGWTEKQMLDEMAARLRRE